MQKNIGPRKWSCQSYLFYIQRLVIVETENHLHKVPLVSQIGHIICTSRIATAMVGPNSGLESSKPEGFTHALHQDDYRAGMKYKIDLGCRQE